VGQSNIIKYEKEIIDFIEHYISNISHIGIITEFVMASLQNKLPVKPLENLIDKTKYIRKDLIEDQNKEEFSISNCGICFLLPTRIPARLHKSF